MGSPHLRHAALRERVDAKIRAAVTEVVRRNGCCDVLEIGAGHRSFTETALVAGVTAAATEMSKASFEHLQKKFADVPQARVVYVTDGNAPLKDSDPRATRRRDLRVCC